MISSRRQVLMTMPQSDSRGEFDTKIETEVHRMTCKLLMSQDMNLNNGRLFKRLNGSR